METKVCTKCAIKKEINNFRLRKDNRCNLIYRNSICKECEKQYKKEHKKKKERKLTENQKLINQGYKKCSTCKEIKTLDNFYYRKKRECYESSCKKCLYKKQMEYIKNNREKVNKATNNYYHNNKEKYKEIHKKYYEKNKDKTKEKDWYKKSLSKRKYYQKNKRKNDIIFKIKCQTRCLIHKSFARKHFAKNGHTQNIIGCDFDFFYNYLLQPFKDNYGYEWDKIEPVHIDHIKPLKYAKTEEDVIKYCHYTNLQLLKAEDNLKKNDKLNWSLKKEE